MDNLKDTNRSKLLMKLPGPPVMLVAIAILAVIAIFLRLSSATNVSANFGDISLAESTYPNIVGSRIDTCALCHTSAPNLNPYGVAYRAGGRGLASSLHAIESADSDGDGFTNIQEINALTFPGDPNDHPTSATATPTSVPPSPTPTRVSPSATPTRVSPSATPTAVGPTATPGGPTATMVPTMQFTPKPTREFTPRPTHGPRVTSTPRSTQTCTDEDQDSDDGGSSGGSGGDDLHITTQNQGGSSSECDSGGDDGGSGGGSRGGGRRGGGGGDDGGGDDIFSGAILLPDRLLADFAGLMLFH